MYNHIIVISKAELKDSIGSVLNYYLKFCFLLKED